MIAVNNYRPDKQARARLLMARLSEVSVDLQLQQQEGKVYRSRLGLSQVCEMSGMQMSQFKATKNYKYYSILF